MIRETESRLVLRLFAFEFFQGAAVALYFTAAITLFITHVGPQGLPKVYIFSALLLWLTGFLYSRLEHRLSTAGLITRVLVFNGLCMLAFRLVGMGMSGNWFLYAFLSAFSIFYLLYNLEFWGLAALLFDVRQSKRLFAIVSSGDMPAKLLGYAMALVFTLAGVINLLWVGTCCLAIALLVFWSLKRADPDLARPPVSHHHFATQSLEQIRASLAGNALIRQVAVVSFFNYGFYILASFMLYGFVKTKFHSDLSLATFFAVFYGASQCLTMGVKTIFTGRLLDSLGLRKALLIAPVTLLAFTIAAYLLATARGGALVFYLIMVLAVSSDLLRSVIQMPVLLSTLQPLSVHHRLRAHTIIKGLMDPFAYLFAGVLLLLLAPSHADQSFRLICIILGLLTLIWIRVTFWVDSSYIRMLTSALRKRTLDERDISLTDADSQNFLLERVQKGSREEAEAVLNLAASQPVNPEKIYLGALSHESREVRRLALQMIGAQKFPETLPELRRILEAQSDPSNTAQLIRTVAALDGSWDVTAYLTHPDPEISGAAAMTLLHHEDPARQALGDRYLARLLDSGTGTERIEALQLIGEMSVTRFSGRVLDLYQEPDEGVRKHALLTLGRLRTPQHIHRLVDLYLEADQAGDLYHALQLAGEIPLPAIRQKLEAGNCNQLQRRRMYNLLGRIASAGAIQLLETALRDYPADRAVVLEQLSHLHFRAGDQSQAFRILIEEALERAAGHIFRLCFLEGDHPRYQIVFDALSLEVNSLRDQLLCLFSFLYDGEKIHRIRSGFLLDTKESFANALELVAMEVPREYSAPFVDLFEKGSLKEKSERLRKHYRAHTITLDHLVREILEPGNRIFTDWTKSCLVYRLQPVEPYQKLVLPYQESQDPILRETARFIIPAV